MIKLPVVYLETVISTAHMSEADNALLTSLAGESEGFFASEYGYDLYPGDDLNSIMDQISEGFRSNLVSIFAAGITHLVIDRDGPVVDGLQVWDW